MLAHPDSLHHGFAILQAALALPHLLLYLEDRPGDKLSDHWLSEQN
jgi:hypothetical protein